MAGFPSVKKGNKRGCIARQPMAGVALDKTVSVDKVKELLTQEHRGVEREV